MTVHSNQTSVTLSGTTTSSSAAYLLGVGKAYLAVTNVGTTLAYVKTGLGSATALVTSVPIEPNRTRVIEKPLDHDFVAAIMQSGTAQIAFAVSSNPQE